VWQRVSELAGNGGWLSSWFPTHATEKTSHGWGTQNLCQVERCSKGCNSRMDDAVQTPPDRIPFDVGSRARCAA